MSDKNSFIFYRSFFEASAPLSDEDKLSLFNAIAEFALNQKEPELTPMAKAMFCLIKPQLQANNKRYENGKKGGRPETETKPKDNLEETKDEPNKNVNVNVNENKKEEKNNKKENLEFDYLWELYDFKKDKQDALKAHKALPAIEMQTLQDSIRDYKNYLKATGYPPCSLAVWLRNRRWENDYKKLTEQHNENTSRTNQNTKSGGFSNARKTPGQTAAELCAAIDSGSYKL